MRIISLDYGTKRIGLAISDPTQFLAQPLKVIQRNDLVTDISEICLIIKNNNVEKVVVGLPLKLDGTMGEIAQEITKFVEELTKVCPVPIVLWKEWYSTKEAERVMIDFDVSRAKRKKNIDRLAATIILQGYLDSLRRPHSQEDNSV